MGARAHACCKAVRGGARWGGGARGGETGRLLWNRIGLKNQLDFRTSDGRVCIGWTANNISIFFLLRLLTVFVYTFRDIFPYNILLERRCPTFRIYSAFNLLSCLLTSSDFSSRRLPHNFESGFSRVVTPTRNILISD